MRNFARFRTTRKWSESWDRITGLDSPSSHAWNSLTVKVRRFGCISTVTDLSTTSGPITGVYSNLLIACLPFLLWYTFL